MDQEQDQDPNRRIQMRFSIRRFEKAMKGLSPKQRGFLIKHGFARYLNLKHQCVYPLLMIEWIMENMIPSLAMFQHGENCIKFSKPMVQQFLGIYSGHIPVKMSSDDPAIIAKVNMLKQKYMKNGSKLFTKLVADSLVGDEDEESFMRSFYLVWLATIVCPSTSDSVEWKYLYSLVDLATMKSSDWCSLCLQCIVVEVESFFKRISKYPNGIPNKPLYVGGCLPILSASYMDYLDLNRAGIHNEINYTVPRIFNVRTSDFKFVLSVDKVPGLNTFGSLNFRANSSTPYSKSAVRLAMEEEFKRNELLLLSLNDGLSGQSSSQPPGIKVKDHVSAKRDDNYISQVNNMVDSIFQSHKAELLRDVQALVDNRVRLMSASIKEALTNENYPGCNRDGGGGVPSNNSVPGHHPRGTAGPSDANAQDTPVFPSSSSHHGNNLAIRSRSAKYGPSTRSRGIRSAPKANEHIVDDNSPLSLREELLSKIAGGTKSISDASKTPRMPKFDHSPAGVSLRSSKRVVFDASPRTNDAKLPVFDNSASPTVGGGTILDDVPLFAPSSIDKRKCRNKHSIPSTDSGERNLFADGAILGSSSVERRKRKQTAGRTGRPPFSVDESVDQFYNKYLANKFFKSTTECEKTIVVDINGHTLTYDKYYHSFKARGDVSNEAMACFVELNNDSNSTDKNSIRKMTFSPMFASKLNVPPENFDVNSVSRELRKLNKRFNIGKCDLLHFPLLHGFHWTSLCVNLKFKKINLLDSLQHVDQVTKSIIASNMVTNFHHACIETNCLDEDLSLFEHEYPDNVPQQNTTFDCGIFVMLYVEHFQGQNFEQSWNVAISEFRKLAAHNMVSSSLNDMTSEIQDFKKQKLS